MENNRNENIYNYIKGGEMKVKNSGGTGDKRCKYSSWLEHWKKHSGLSLPSTCVAKGCGEKPEVGGHVIKVDSNDKDKYIIPICSKHNAKSNDDPYEVEKSVKFVSAIASKICDKE